MEGNVSLWEGTTPATEYPVLTGAATADVAVVGGGITGLTAAYLLAVAGVSVAVVERRRIATGTTGNTTAKVTSLHGLAYADLARRHGDDVARRYGEANQAALEEVARIIAAEAIDCDFRRIAAYTYTHSAERVADIEREVDAASRLGLPASFTDAVPLPYATAAAVRFDGQALFHPRKYCLALAEAIVARGGLLFEESRATSIEKRDGRYEVRTPEGSVTAAHVIQATLLPFDDPAGTFAKTHASRSYALASEITGPAPDGMFLGIDDPGRSVRPHWSDGRTYLVIGGEEHKTGQDTESDSHFGVLERWARTELRVDRVDYRWSAQDYIPADGIPYVGRLIGGTDGMLAATGFKKWGMTNGTAAAMMLRDIVLEAPNPWLEVFDPRRLKPRQAIGELVGQNVDVARRFVGGRVSPAPALVDVPPGQGTVVQEGGRRLAVYRDDNGDVTVLSARCTHMGCLVAFNPAERSWDCPCHGSRFDLTGAVIEGPATEPLAAEPPAASEGPAAEAGGAHVEGP